MQAVGLTRASIFSPIIAFLERAGASVERLFVKVGLPPWVLSDPEALIPTSLGRFLKEAARSEGIEQLGLLAGQEARIESLGVYGQLIRKSPTLGDALEKVVRDHPTFSSNGQTGLVSHGESVEVRAAFTKKFDESDQGWQQATHYILMLMLGVVRLGAGPTWRPAKVDLQSAESAVLRDAEALSDAHLAFGQPATAITFPRALLEKPIRPPRPDLEVPAERIDAWEATRPAGDFVGSIVQVVDMLSWSGYPDVHMTADILGMSVRTLQRHLAAAGVTHEALVGRARFATAAALLEETDTKILDIALDLGYADHAHFTRAFRRWAQCSPQEFRRGRREGTGASTRKLHFA